jgi:tRNA 2-selenouridine synthase
MTLLSVPAAEALRRLGEFDSVIDARSPSEFAQDHLPHALNWPSLDDEQRRFIGTMYKQESPFEARKRGAALVAANIARHIEREVLDKPRGWLPLVYCWRGGKRSGALALVLDQIGFRVALVEGGYKAFRAALLDDLQAQVARLSYQVVCGPTGSGKTRLLQALAAQGAQVLDLEDLANHRSSVLGIIPGQPQPTQKRFDNLVWQRLRGFDARRPVFVESESKKVGNLAVPDGLMAAMRASPCWRLDLERGERVALLLEDYDFFVRDPELFCSRLDALVAVRGRALVEEWKTLVAQRRFGEVVHDLLLRHYDPGYAASTQRNFAAFESARLTSLRHRGADAMMDAARSMLQAAAGPAAAGGAASEPSS